MGCPVRYTVEETSHSTRHHLRCPLLSGRVRPHLPMMQSALFSAGYFAGLACFAKTGWHGRCRASE